MRPPGTPLIALSLLYGALSGCGSPQDTAIPGDSEWPSTYPMDTELRVSQGQAIGTHNSYHQELEDNPIAAWMYTHPPLEDQLDLGVRQFELDIVRDPESGEVLVQHVPFFDDGSSCRSFTDCLTILREWSIAHPWHFPLQVLVEPKDEMPSWSVNGHFDEVDAEMRAVWGDDLFDPERLKGDHTTLRSAVVDEGWPLLAELRGGCVFVLLDTGDQRADYTEEMTDLDGRAMFVLAEADHDFAAYFLRDDPTDTESIQALSQAGFLIRTRIDNDLALDPERHDLAIASGAHALSTDAPEQAGMASDHPVSCNPVTAPVECQVLDLE